MRSNCSFLLLAGAITFLSACGAGKPTTPTADKQTTELGNSTDTVNTKKSITTTLSIDTPAPPHRPTTRISPNRLTPIALPSKFSATDKTGVYLSIPLTGDLPTTLLENTRNNVTVARHTGIDWNSNIDQRHTVAVVAYPEESTDETFLLLRVVGRNPLPREFEITLRANSSLRHNGELVRGRERVITVNNTTAQRNKQTPNLFRSALAKWFMQQTNNEAFSHFASFSAARLAANDNIMKHPGYRSWTGGKSDLSVIMDFYTGSSNIKAAMAMDRGLGHHQRQRTTIPINTISGVDRIHRDYDALAAKLHTDTPRFGDIGRYLPADAITITFKSLLDFAISTTVLDTRLGRIARVVEETPGHFALKERYGEQMALDFTALARRLGHDATGATALVFTDPYLREGTGASLVFINEDPAMLNRALAHFATKAENTRGSLKKQVVRIDAYDVELLSSPDNRVRRYQIQLPEITIVSNSAGAMKQLLNVHDKKSGALMDAPDYRYARTVVPFDANQETAFLFLGDTLMTALTSPAAKILESRRMRAKAELDAVNYAVLLHGWMEGQPIASLKELKKSSWFSKSDLTHFDGSRISWSPENGAISQWGTSDALVPIIDLPVNKVSEAEKTAYETFRDDYNNYWAGRLDPTLIRLEHDTDNSKITARIHILPISENSRYADEYRTIRELAGTANVAGGNDPNGLDITLALGPNARLRREMSGSLEMMGGPRLALEVLGAWGQVGISNVGDVRDLLNNKFAAGLHQNGAGEHDQDVLDATIMNALPVWLQLEVGNPLAFVGAFAAIRAMTMKAASDLVTWEPELPADNNGLQITHITVQTGSHTGNEAESITLFYTVVDGVFAMALRKDILLQQIERIRNRSIPQTTTQLSLGGQLVSNLSLAKNGWMRPLINKVIERAGWTTHQRGVWSYSVLARCLATGYQKPDAFRHTALTYLGYLPASPYGKEFRLLTDGTVEHPLYGTAFEPVLPGDDKPLPPLIDDLNAFLSITGDIASQQLGEEAAFTANATIAF